MVLRNYGSTKLSCRASDNPAKSREYNGRFPPTSLFRARRRGLADIALYGRFDPSHPAAEYQLAQLRADNCIEGSVALEKGRAAV